MPACFQNPVNGQWAVVMMALDLVVLSEDSEYWAMAGVDGGLRTEGEMDGPAFLQPGA